MNLIEFPDKKCEHCGDMFNRSRRPSGRPESPDDFRIRRFCCHECSAAFHVGVNHPNFKADNGKPRYDGYVRVTVARGVRKYRHRAVVERVLGRELESTEHIHHKDEVPGHDVPENLDIKTNSEHRQYHARTQLRGQSGVFVCQK